MSSKKEKSKQEKQGNSHDSSSIMSSSDATERTRKEGMTDTGKDVGTGSSKNKNG